MKIQLDELKAKIEEIYEETKLDGVGEAWSALCLWIAQYEAAQQSVQRTCAKCGANDWRDAIVPDTLEICNNCGAIR